MIRITIERSDSYHNRFCNNALTSFKGPVPEGRQSRHNTETPRAGNRSQCCHGAKACGSALTEMNSTLPPRGDQFVRADGRNRDRPRGAKKCPETETGGVGPRKVRRSVGGRYRRRSPTGGGRISPASSVARLHRPSRGCTSPTRPVQSDICCSVTLRIFGHRVMINVIRRWAPPLQWWCGLQE